MIFPEVFIDSAHVVVSGDCDRIIENAVGAAYIIGVPFIGLFPESIIGVQRYQYRVVPDISEIESPVVAPHDM